MRIYGEPKIFGSPNKHYGFNGIWGTEILLVEAEASMWQPRAKPTLTCVAFKSFKFLNTRVVRKNARRFVCASSCDLWLRFFLRSLAYTAVTKVDNVDGQTKSKRWVINGCATRISRDSKKLFGKRDGVAGEGFPRVRVTSLSSVFLKYCFRRR